MQWAWIRQATRQWISVTTRTSRGAANCDYNGQVGVYGTQGPPAVGIVRGSRDSAVMWVDSSWHFWLFGGEGLNASGLQRIGLLGTLNALGIRLSHRPMDLDGGGSKKFWPNQAAPTVRWERRPLQMLHPDASERQAGRTAKVISGP
jgi:hypothetical protein